MGSRCCLSLPVLVVLVLYGFVYYTTVWLVIEPWLGFGTVNGLLNLVFLTLVALMGLLSYACAILRDPGAVPPGWIPDSEDGDEAIQEVKRKGGEVRYCQKCSHYKPARAHHCRVCKRCVLRMDHHCVWINNCVGYHNYKSFFLFVLYVVTACSHSLVLMFGQMMDSIAESNDEEGNEAWQRSESASTSTAISTLFRVRTPSQTSPQHPHSHATHNWAAVPLPLPGISPVMTRGQSTEDTIGMRDGLQNVRLPPLSMPGYRLLLKMATTPGHKRTGEESDVETCSIW